MALNEIRSRIDSIDTQIADLLKQRMDIVGEVAESKRETGKSINDHAREREVINRVTKIAGDEYAPYVKDIYRLMMELSRTYQSTKLMVPSETRDRLARYCAEGEGKKLPNRALVACQGSEGAYAQQACEHVFEYPDILYFSSFDGVFGAVEKGMCEYGILPVENSTAGSVTQVYDLMEKHSFQIVGACRLRIDHRLMRRKGTKGKITTVYSHEQALRQCSDYLSGHPEITAVQMHNTASAAKFVAESDRDDVAVIASKACADQYSLEIVDESVSNEKINTTRFICISRKPEIYPGANKVSIMFNLPNEAGALNAITSRLAIAGVSVTKLESRPIPGQDFAFRFFFDMEVDLHDPDMCKLIAEIEARTDHFVFLGAYREIM